MNEEVWSMNDRRGYRSMNVGVGEGVDYECVEVWSMNV
jgi:hypothetical protein